MKYNSNSGYISDINRLTPQVTWCVSTCTRMFCINNYQAFSHFTFEKSGHQLIVVDIQGIIIIVFLS